MAVLEAYLPQFFRGAKKLSNQFSEKHNANPHPKLDNETRYFFRLTFLSFTLLLCFRSILEERLSLEYEFYKGRG